MEMNIKTVGIVSALIVAFSVPSVLPQNLDATNFISGGANTWHGAYAPRHNGSEPGHRFNFNKVFSLEASEPAFEDRNAGQTNLPLKHSGLAFRAQIPTVDWPKPDLPEHSSRDTTKLNTEKAGMTFVF